MTEIKNVPVPVLPHIDAMAPYALADLSVPEGKTRVMLAQNESLFPPSPAVFQAVQSILPGVNFYPDADWSELRGVIAGVHNLPASQILCGAGSMELIGALARAYANPENRILTSEFGYAYFRTVARINQAGLDLAPETDFTVSVDALLGHVRPDTRLVFLANPGNPTGTSISRDEVLRLRKGLADDVLLVVDEAYGEFADASDESVFNLVGQGNTVVLRTFSKAYGLAGMRVGWGLFPPEIAGHLRKLLNPNNISLSSQAAAIAAIGDQSYMKTTVQEISRIREDFVAKVRLLGVEVPDSFTNFVLLRFTDAVGAKAVDLALRAEGILVRGMGSYGLEDCLRVTIGAEADMDRVYGIIAAVFD